MRPGRLDRILYVGPPNLEGRIEILRIRTQKMSVEANLDLEQSAKLVRYCASSFYEPYLKLHLCRLRDVLAPRCQRCAKKRHY